MQFPIGPFELMIILLLWLLLVVPFWRIFAKAGYSGALSLLMILPGINLIMLYFLAFATWPNQKSR